MSGVMEGDEQKAVCEYIEEKDNLTAIRGAVEFSQTRAYELLRVIMYNHQVHIL